VHRSRLSVLVISAAMAACSTHDDSDGTKLLSQDSTLVARLEVDRDARQVALPAACGKVVPAVQPAAPSQTQAKELTQQAQDAEMHGNIRVAQSLLRRAVDLDGTSKSAAYHLGRTSEALGDRTTAMTAYCRYLTLTPTAAESAEARQRVTELSKPVTRVAAGSISERATTVRRAATVGTRRVSVRGATSDPRTRARGTVEQSAATMSPERSPERTPRPSDPVPSRTAADTTVSAATQSDAVETPRATSTVDRPATASSSARRGPSRAQSAIVGAATGAIIGAATGRSVKGAVIGAAAGGVLGTVVGSTVRPAGGRR
jgi:hypothetical protein